MKTNQTMTLEQFKAKYPKVGKGKDPVSQYEAATLERIAKAGDFVTVYLVNGKLDVFVQAWKHGDHCFKQRKTNELLG